MKKNSESKKILRFQKGTSNLKSQIVTSSLNCQNGISRSDAFMQDTGELENQIRLVRGQYVILDYELAKLYGVGTGALNRAVKRNSTRFPSDFMFQLTKEECENLKCQFGISSWGGSRFQPYAFTEHGVAMLSGVLKSPIAISVNIQIMRAFIAMRLVCKATNWPKPTATEIAKFNRQYKGLTVGRSDNFHDRFVIIDGAELYNLGSSINSLGRRLTTYTTRDPKEIEKVLANV